MYRQSISLLIIFIIFSQTNQNVYALNILAIISLPLRSHYMAFHRLFEELSIRGHSVTVLNNYPQSDLPKNFTFVDMTVVRPNWRPMPSMSDFEKIDSRIMHLNNFYNHFVVGSMHTANDCYNFFTNPNVKSFRQKGEKFDVIFVEQFMSDCGLAYAAVMYDAPIIGITSHTLLPWAYPRLGLPFNVASDAFYFSTAGQNPSLYDKVEVFVLNFLMVNIGRWYLSRDIYKVFNEHYLNSALDVEKIARERIKMMFVYQHHSITGGRLLSPQVLEIGGIHIRKQEPIPKKIEEFLSDAKHGAIYVSFGSNLKANTMSAYKMKQFLEAFKKLPQKVIWKLDNMTVPVGYDNLYTDSWLPQRDILCHPKVLAFISHGGMLSLSEAAHCGKPLLAMPFFGDQFSNAAAVSQSGLGIKMYFQDLNADNFVATVNKLISPEMQHNAQKISKLWHDRPADVLESAIYWTEYVARHKAAPPSLPSIRNSWFELLLIDVYVVLLILILFVLLIIYLILRVLFALFRLFTARGKHKSD